mgnify:CR=1 FL=1
MLYGEHHLEEIMWQERLGREPLADLLAHYESAAYLLTIVTTDEGVEPETADEADKTTPDGPERASRWLKKTTRGLHDAR